MGYRSSGKIYIPNDVYDNMDNKFKISLQENWYSEEDNFWCFDGWKWYDGYEEVDMWNKFYYDNIENGVDFIVIGEDGTIVIEPQFIKLGYSMIIETY